MVEIAFAFWWRVSSRRAPRYPNSAAGSASDAVPSHRSACGAEQGASLVELRWSGSLGIRWVFDGEHAFLLESIGGGNTRFRQEERFVGILASLIMRGGMLEATRQGFVAMNEALKQRAEAAR